MAGILDHQGIFYQQGVLSTKQFRDSILNRNLPPPVNQTLIQGGLTSKLDDIGRVINVPILGTSDENIPIHYDEDKKLFPLGEIYRLTQNVNLNSYKPQNDEYITYNLTIPPNLGYPLPEGFGEKPTGQYPTTYFSDRFELVNKGDKKGVAFPFNAIDKYKSLNFTSESSLGLIGGQELEKTIIDKIAQVEDEFNDSTDSTGYITEPVGNPVNNYVETLRGNDQFFNTLPNDAVGWNEYNGSNKIPGGEPDVPEGVEPTMGLEVRMGTLLSRTSLEQVKFTFNLLNRNNYRPLYNDRRLQGTSEEGTNGRYYIGTEKNTNRGSLITKTFDSSDFNGENTDSGQKTDIQGIGTPFGEYNKFFWTTGGESNFNPKTLLYKTQQLVDNNQDDVFINQTRKYFKDKKQNRLISRGNGITEIQLLDISSNANFCRVWTPTDRYSYFNAIRNTGLFTSPNGGNGFSATPEKASLSVLMDNGIPKIHPAIESPKTERKKFMLSLENLAWADNLADLPKFEIGSGDPVSGNKGRIMWFPPYDLKFDEQISTNWTPTDFIGRSEPVYTYNNTKRSGSLSFKVLVDHPRVINCYRGKNNNLNERFFAGCVTPEDYLNALECTVPEVNYAEIKKKLNQTELQTVTSTDRVTEEGLVKLVTTVDCSTSPESCRLTMVPNETDITNLITQVKNFVELQNGNTNPKTKITFNGRVGPAAKLDEEGNVTNGKKLSKQYAEEVKTQVENGLSSSGLDEKLLKNIKYVVKGNKAFDSEDNDEQYRVDVEMESDIENSKEVQVKKEVKLSATGTLNPEEIEKLDTLFIDEAVYFQYIDVNYPNYFKTISEKIKYFHPGYHSITPEGFNSRLTFLNQCMKQGPSIYDKKTTKNGVETGLQPQNLSFGRPPICILRIGDFFYTKVVINSLSITYDGPQYDLNPEGIGIQPMIASVTLSLDYIGGSSLSGPISRLQNAVSFNYYANTEMYDLRSDTIKDGNIEDGIKLGQIKEELSRGNDEENLKDQNELDQLSENENNDDNEEESEDGNLITLSINGNNVVATSTESPSEYTGGGNKTKEDNVLKIIVKTNKEKDKLGEPSSVEVGIDLYSTENREVFNLVSSQQIIDADKKVSDAEEVVTLLESQIVSNASSTLISALSEAEINLQNAKSERNALNNIYEFKFSVEAFFTEFKTKTKVKQTFTITENGIE